MNVLTTVKQADTVDRVPATLSERLEWLRKFGKPRLGMYGSSKGWHANVEMNTNTTGSSFEVKSDFSHDTPDEAVDELINRMLNTLATIRGGVW